MVQTIMKDDFVNQFIESINSELPGYILLFNLADTKRRNLYLGFDNVDNELNLFDELIKEFINTDSKYKRVGGNDWLVLIKNDPTEIVEFLKNSYTTENELI